MEGVKSVTEMFSCPRTIQYQLPKMHSFKKHLLVIGQSGHGKTTFVNGLFNYLNNSSPEKFIYITDFLYNRKNIGILDFVTESKYNTLKSFEEFKQQHDNGEGITQKCIKYTCKNGFVIYDTPGLSDGKGLEQDDKNIENILYEASQAGHLDAVIYIINSTISRQDPAIKNSINRLSSIIPDLFSTSFILVHTFSNKGKSKFQKSWLPFTPRSEFFIDIDLFENTQEFYLENKMAVDGVWEECKDVFKKLTAEINNMSSKNVNEYKILFNQHNSAKSQYTELKVKTKNLLNLKSTLESHILVYANYQKFYEEQQINVIEYIQTDYHNTLCMLCDIHTCHEKCRLELIQHNGSELFNNCACMNPQKICKVCTHNHKQHYHDHKIPISTKKTVKKLIESFQEQNLEETVDIEEVKELEEKINEVSNHMALVEKEINNRADDLIKTAKLMKGICSKFDMSKQIKLEKDFVNKEIHNNQLSIERMNELQNWSMFLDRLYLKMIDVNQGR